MRNDRYGKFAFSFPAEKLDRLLKGGLAFEIEVVVGRIVS